MNKREQLQSLIDYYCQGNKTQFANKLGISPQGVTTWLARDTFNIELVYAKCENISPSWLLTGKGRMINTTPSHDALVVTESLPTQYASKNIDICPMDCVDPRVTRPRIPFTAAAGALSIATDSAGDADCERLPVIATFPAYDFTIKIEGDSMAPDYLSGDELACRFVDDPANIKWGEPHILDTRDGVVFKIPYYGGDQIMCRSINPDGPSFLVDRADVLHVASIVGFTRQLQS